MRKLQLPGFHRDESAGPSLSASDPVTWQKNIDLARENGSNMIFSATSVENLLEEIITSYLFDVDDQAQMDFFRATILEAHFFSFHSKWKVFREILDLLREEGFLESRERKEIARNTSRIIAYRNAFAHGDIFRRNEVLYIRYFKGGVQEDELDETYWAEVEQVFTATVPRLRELAAHLCSGKPRKSA